MKFSTASNFAKTLIICSMVMCILGLFLTDESYLMFREGLTIGAFLCLLIALFVILTYCKCPYCGKRIFFGATKVVYCPNCRRNLETGKKVSKRKSKTMKK